MDGLALIGVVAALGIGLLAGYAAGRRQRAHGGSQDGPPLRRALDTAPIGVMINTRDGANLYHNQKLLETFRCAPDDLARGVEGIYVRPEDRARYVDRLYRDGQLFQQLEFRRRDGEVYTGTMTSAVMEFEGRPAHITWFHDLTEKIQADTERHELAERLHMALEANGAAAWDADVVNHTCWWSDTFPSMLGFDHVPEMPFDFWERRLHPDDRERVLATIDAYLSGAIPLYDYSYRLRREDGGWIWVEAKGRAIRDESGRAVRYVGIMTDVSARRRQEELVRASEERLLRILEASPISVNITSRDGRWLFCNPQTERIIGRPRAELMRTPATGYYADPAVRTALMARLASEGAFRDAEVAFRRLDGTIVWVLASWDEIEFEGEPAYLTWLYDITDRKTAESELTAAKEAAEHALNDLRVAQESLIQAETMASLGQLVAGVAHEINTPIGIGLTAATHIAEQTERLRGLFGKGAVRRSDFADYLQAVEEGSRLLVSNINRAAELVQSFKQVAVDQSSGGRRAFDLKTYIDEVLFSLQPRLKRTRVTVSVDCPDDLTMDSYPGALSQVLTNLMINAVVHAYGEGAAGHVRIAVHGEGEDAVALDFVDDGKGIPPDVLPRIFDPFFTTKRGEGGSGLGLHIVYNTVSRVLGGRLSVDSRLGEGTRFTLNLPRVAPQAAEDTLAAGAP
ncbi:PAS domain S-box protein [Azospirillum sp.]|uniref:PAS domain-containing sensor histidine kinase n=1 Tax=Azospirillum sp. TaxID=34012 RepID=UPI002D6A611A|nr:PAS domain S-box protein [Azospirillum sp.]HYD65030.1 PAS domain S-box protein [Azospirillum sp.]